MYSLLQLMSVYPSEMNMFKDLGLSEMHVISLQSAVESYGSVQHLKDTYGSNLIAHRKT